MKKFTLQPEGSFYTMRFKRAGKEKFAYYLILTIGMIISLVALLNPLLGIVPSNGTTYENSRIVVIQVMGFVLLMFIIVSIISSYKRPLVINVNDGTISKAKFRLMGMTLFKEKPLVKVSSEARIILKRDHVTKFIARRLYRVQRSYGRRRIGYLRHFRVDYVTWDMIIDDGNKKTKIFSYSSGSIPVITRILPEIRIPIKVTNAPWLDAAVESIAEKLQIIFEDQTGIEPILRKPGEIDEPLVILMKREYPTGVPLGDIKTRIPEEYSQNITIDKMNEEYVITAVHDPRSTSTLLSTLIGLMFAVVGVVITAIFLTLGIMVVDMLIKDIEEKTGPITLSTIPVILLDISLVIGLFLAAGILIGGLPYLLAVMILSGEVGSNIISIEPGYVTLRHKGRVFTKVTGKMEIPLIERLPVVMKWSRQHTKFEEKRFTLEFTTDEGRISLPGYYFKDEALLLQEIVKRTLALL